jgi:hypothetical protein
MLQANTLGINKDRVSAAVAGLSQDPTYMQRNLQNSSRVCGQAMMIGNPYGWVKSVAIYRFGHEINIGFLTGYIDPIWCNEYMAADLSDCDCVEEDAADASNMINKPCGVCGGQKIVRYPNAVVSLGNQNYTCVEF